MKRANEIKDLVRSRYGEIACADEGAGHGAATSCCGSGGGCGCSGPGVNFADSYAGQQGHVAGADLGLGCGLPTAFSTLRPGQTVLDLGSGAGNDAFVARAHVGATGRVIGLDFTPEMVARARDNARSQGLANVQFLEGDIEDIPLPAAAVDVVISNCVLNLVPDKARAFAEIFRVLKPGGQFSISDVVLEGELTPALGQAAALYAGCVAGAMQRADYLDLIAAAGFEAVEVVADKAIELPRTLLSDLLDEEELREFARSRVGIFSITVRGTRPGKAIGP